ncbi:hypothetical protein B0H16DRAFT_1598242 [Mycena metata]|uniref:Uncharacterized protein n=1 Tax=Mycena metata TaxID=1033252 RepID=A0AAD7MMD2_9AGAR|nr:hypothetical protein B0H16DRAFT_1598242 [Mycena metata]
MRLPFNLHAPHLDRIHTVKRRQIAVDLVALGRQARVASSARPRPGGEGRRELDGRNELGDVARTGGVDVQQAVGVVNALAQVAVTPFLSQLAFGFSGGNEESRTRDSTHRPHRRSICTVLRRAASRKAMRDASRTPIAKVEVHERHDEQNGGGTSRRTTGYRGRSCWRGMELDEGHSQQ